MCICGQYNYIIVSSFDNTLHALSRYTSLTLTFIPQLHLVYVKLENIHLQMIDFDCTEDTWIYCSN